MSTTHDSLVPVALVSLVPPPARLPREWDAETGDYVLPAVPTGANDWYWAPDAEAPATARPARRRK